MRRYNEEQEIESLLKKIQFENRRIRKVSEDIEQSLREVKRLFQQIKGNINKHETVRNLWLGQLRNGGIQEFQNVTDVVPTTPPMVPSVPPAPATPSPLFPLTETQQTLISNILSTAREIGRVRRQIGNTIAAIIGGNILLRRRLAQLRLGAPLEGPSLAEIHFGLLVLISQLGNLRVHLDGLQEDLDINISLLANTVL